MKEGDVLAKITKAEAKQIRILTLEKQALKELFKTFIATMTDTEAEREHNKNLWWEKMRQKYALPKESELHQQGLTITLWHETGELQVRKLRGEDR